MSDIDIDTEWTDVPVCPHCGARLNEWWDGLGFQRDGDSNTLDCGRCERRYIARMCVDVSFSTEPVEAGAEGKR